MNTPKLEVNVPKSPLRTSLLPADLQYLRNQLRASKDYWACLRLDEGRSYEEGRRASYENVQKLIDSILSGDKDREIIFDSVSPESDKSSS